MRSAGFTLIRTLLRRNLVNVYGFTLIEILVVISIIAIISLLGVANFKSFSDKQPGIKAQGEIQTLLRLAQANASSSTNCSVVANPERALFWSLKIQDSTKLFLHCTENNSAGPPKEIDYRQYDLQNAEVSQVTCDDKPINLPTKLTYPVGSNLLLSSDSTCVSASSWKIKIKNLKDNSFKEVVVTKGGTINVQ